MPHIEDNKTYKWAHPSEWLGDKIDRAAHAEDIAALVSICNTLMQRTDEDDIQEDFQSEMDAEGYFKPLIDDATIQAIAGKPVVLDYACRDIGYGVESGTVDGQFTGECDTWGKWTFQPTNENDDLLFLFADEVLEISDLENIEP